jgi:hypothetical protein
MLASSCMSVLSVEMEFLFELDLVLCLKDNCLCSVQKTLRFDIIIYSGFKWKSKG